MNDAVLRALREAVAARLAVVADHALRDRDPGAHLEALRTAADALDTLVRQLPADADPMLRHYLERQSFTKALAWLDERTPRPPAPQHPEPATARAADSPEASADSMLEAPR